MDHIHTLEFHHASILAALALTYGAPGLAASLIERIGVRAQRAFASVYCVALTVAAGFAIASGYYPEPFWDSRLLLQIILGLAGGASALWAGLLIQGGQRFANWTAIEDWLLEGRRGRKSADRVGVPRSTIANLITVTYAAGMEEYLHRGFVLTTILQWTQSKWLSFVCIGLAVLAFAALHASKGPQEILSKIALSIVTTMLAISTGTITASVLAHVTFNVLAVNATR